MIQRVNSALHTLGFDARDRVVVIHADDIGMCQATLPACAELFDAGLVSSAAVMVPCPWFPAAAAYCRAHPEADMGVHLTLNCEWNSYRWGPISTRDLRSGLIDAEGYFHRRTADVWANADAGAVQVELQAQLDRALQAGIDATHVDTHMGTLAHRKFLPAYVQLTVERELPPMLIARDEESWRARGMDAEAAADAARTVQELGARGLPLFDDLVGLPLDQPAERMAQAKHIFDNLAPGLTLLLIHPAHDTPELRAIAPDWRSRVADFETFVSAELRDYVHDARVHMIGYRALREIMRPNASITTDTGRAQAAL